MNAGCLRSKVPLFEGFSESNLAELAAGSRVEAFVAGESVARSGEELQSLGIVLEGRLVASVPDEHGGDRFVGRLGPGDTFGEMALLTGEAAVADLQAEEASRVMFVPLTLFLARVMSEPGAARRIAGNIGARLHLLLENPGTAALLALGKDEDGLVLKSERHQRVLVLNCGSSSMKWSVFDTARPDLSSHGHVAGIGSGHARLAWRSPAGDCARDLPQDGHGSALTAMLEILGNPRGGAIAGNAGITVVGHRVVHGGGKFTAPVVIDDAVLAELDELAELAPLHNPANIQGIREARRVFPAVPHIAVFDTAFHSTLPSHAFLYGLPFECYETRKIRRFGFHGPSHAYVTLAAGQFLKRRPRELRIVSCHLGSGASLCAIDHGRSIDTTMGFTPGEGLVMGTRCGDIDSGILTYLERTTGLSAARLDTILNKESGLLGLSGVSGGMREIEAAADAGNPRALIALKVFCYRVRKAIGAYVAALGGIDVLAFTAGIGQGSPGVRAAAVQGLQCMGIHLDEPRNREADGKQLARISSDDSPVTVLVVPADEERMIARETLRAMDRDYLVRACEACRAKPVPIEVSAHHVHLSQDHVEALFGAGHVLARRAGLSQPGQYASEDDLTVIGPKGSIGHVRVLGPPRASTQVEIAMTEQFKLGIHPPIRDSGDLEGTPGCVLEGPAGRVTLDKGVICALRHIHMTPEDALRYGLRDKCTVKVRVAGDREMVFGDVRVRVNPNAVLAMHIDTDEANAADLKTGAQGFIEGIQAED